LPIRATCNKACYYVIIMPLRRAGGVVMGERHVYVFLGTRDWEFYAVEAAHSDEALESCLKAKKWSWSEIVYLGRLEGLPPSGHLYDRWDPKPPSTDPPGIRESAPAYAL
jgi:hypothetical protein